MTNIIEASIAYSFKGETYQVSAAVDLDGMMMQYGAVQGIHRLLASKSGIDTYSYQYEVMEMQGVTYGNAGGLAAKCLDHGHFDIPKFERLWVDSKLQTVLAPIAMTHLGIDDLDQHPDIKGALVAAYNSDK